MYNQSNIEKQYEIAGSKLAADTLLYRITSLGLSVQSILWIMGRAKKSKVYELIPRDHTTVTHNVTRLIEDGYVHEQVISHKEKYISLTVKGRELYAEFINKSAAFTQKLRLIKEKRNLARQLSELFG